MNEMQYFPHVFDATIERYDYGKYFYTIVIVPGEVIAELPIGGRPRLRIDGEIDGEPIDAGLLPDRLGSAQTPHLVGRFGEAGDRIWYMIVSKKLLGRIGRSVGETVEVRLRVGDQDAVEIPAALQSRLEADAAFAEAWERLTPGKRRAHARRVQTAKREETIRKRVQEVYEQTIRG